MTFVLVVNNLRVKKHLKRIMCSSFGCGRSMTKCSAIECVALGKGMFRAYCPQCYREISTSHWYKKQKQTKKKVKKE